MVGSIAKADDETVSPFVEQLAAHGASASKLAEGVRDLPRMVDGAAAEQFDGTNRRRLEQLRGFDIRIKATESRLYERDFSLAALHNQMRSIGEALFHDNTKPVVPIVNSAGFDQETDPTIARAFAGKLAELRTVRRSIHD
ncbi:unnamed protein product [Prorocentrum cordatum]|uniref:Uncharacterized protein n=1 Tax=Prorocentrum cordatum TaxID=2364126 RepID=A0ABN9TYQ2_9DINO|nr:unnamed protein product [Polarella glacialis]